MADWYVSSATYASVPVWAATTAYTVGQFIKPLTVPGSTAYVYRCTTAGTTAGTEPTWTGASANNATITSGTAVFTNVTGQSTYGWAAAAGTLFTIAASTGNRTLAGDRVFLSSDHSENTTGSGGVIYNFNNTLAAFGVVQIISVNRAGSVPPVASDAQSGAAITNTGTSGSPYFILDAHCNLFWQGITFTLAGTGTALSILFNNTAAARKSHYLKNCAVVLITTLAAARITTSNVAKVTFDNTTIQFGNVAQAISNTGPFDFNWINTPSAIVGATIPTTLFTCGTSAPPLSVTCRGVDLSAIVGTLCSGTTGSVGGSMKALFDSCKIASGVTRLATPAAITNAGDEIELVNCFDGTNIINERYAYGGAMTIDRSTTLSGGAQDNVGNYSLKLVSNTRADFQTMPLDAFWFDVENIVTGASKTATVEIASPLAGLNDNNIRLLLEYMGTSGSSLAGFTDSLASVLTPAAALPSSSNSWAAPGAFATWNPRDLSGLALSNGDLSASTVAGTSSVRANLGFDSGVAAKYYWEIVLTSHTNFSTGYGIALPTVPLPYSVSSAVGTASISGAAIMYVNGVSTGVSFAFSLGTGNVISIAVDTGAGLIWFRRVLPSLSSWNNNGAANPATGVGGFNISALSGKLFPSFTSVTTVDVATANFGASAFSGTVPSGFTSGLPMAPTNKQLLQATFTPRTAGRVRGLVRLGKVATTVWVNPQVAIT